ncbi:hypothetical protein HK102_000990 [Quaeritorhiza haematococci]|nr:hypothetical protein HK102_000990 [Quaeritorhiza haematococci]
MFSQTGSSAHSSRDNSATPAPAELLVHNTTKQRKRARPDTFGSAATQPKRIRQPTPSNTNEDGGDVSASAEVESLSGTDAAVMSTATSSEEQHGCETLPNIRSESTPDILPAAAEIPDEDTEFADGHGMGTRCVPDFLMEHLDKDVDVLEVSDDELEEADEDLEEVWDEDEPEEAVEVGDGKSATGSGTGTKKGTVKKKLGVTLEVLNLLRICFYNSLGPDRFCALLREMHTKRRDTLELQYLDHLSHIQQKGSQTTIGQPKLFQTFSAFDDQSGYAGYVPSAVYLRSIYNDFVEKHRCHVDQHMAMLDGTVLKGDTSYKVTKHIGKINGSPVWDGLYTLLNGDEEIKQQVWTYSKSMAHLTQPMQDVLESLQRFGRPPPEIFFTDNVAGEKTFLESVFPSLLQDVVPVDSIRFGHLQQLKVPDDVSVHIFDRAGLAGVYIDAEILSDIPAHETNYIVIGFDAEWNYDPNTKVSGRTAVVQIAYKKTIYIFQISSWKELPPQFNILLTCKRVIKVGRMVNGDLQRLGREYKLTKKPCGALDLGRLCSQQGIVKKGNVTLAALCSAALSKYLPKDDIRVGQWDVDKLSEKQVEYAARDAWASLKIYEAAVQLQQVGTIPQRQTAGTPVSVLSPDGMLTIGEGFITQHESGALDGVNVTKTRALVTITKVVVPATMIRHYNGKAIGDFGTPPFSLVFNLKDLRTRARNICTEPVNTETPLTNQSTPESPTTDLDAHQNSPESNPSILSKSQQRPPKACASLPASTKSVGLNGSTSDCSAT